MSHSISPEVLPNELKLLIFSYLDPTSLLSIFRASTLFNQLALVTLYTQHGLSPPFSQASFSSSIFPGLSLALSFPPLDSLTFTFDTPDVYLTLEALRSFCARSPYSIPRIRLIFQYSPLRNTKSRSHIILETLESLLITATDSGQGGSLVRVTPDGVHLMPVSSPLRPELDYFEPRPGSWDWENQARPVGVTTIECEGIVSNVEAMVDLASIEINLPSETIHHTRTDSELPMRPLLIFNRGYIRDIYIPPKSKAPIPSLQIEEFLRDRYFPALRVFDVPTCHSCVANTTFYYSFLARHPLIRVLAYSPACVDSTWRGSISFQNVSFLYASPEFLSYCAEENPHKDAESPNNVPSADLFPSLKALAISSRGDAGSPSTLSYPTSYRAVTDAVLHIFSSRSDRLYLGLSLLEDGHEDEWLVPYDFPPPSPDRTSTPSMPYLPCVVTLGLDWYPRWMIPVMPGYLQRFPALEKLQLIDLVWDRKTSDAWWGGVGGGGDKRERERPEEWEWFRHQEVWKVRFLRELKRACPLLTLLMIGKVSRGLDEWEAIFAAE